MLSAGEAGVETSRLEQISEWRGRFLSPDGVYGGSKGMDSVAVWSRHDLVPGLLSGFRISKFALFPGDGTAGPYRDPSTGSG